MHDLAKHAKNVHQWAESLRGPLTTLSLRAGLKQTVDDMITSADIVGMITSSMDKLALGRDDHTVRVKLDERLEALQPVLQRLDPKIGVNVRGTATVIGPDSLVERIIFNLVMNSLHWTDDKRGKIAIELNVDREADEAVLSVADNGQGMTPEQIAVVCEPFESFRENGSGLGLYLVTQLCNSVGAQLSISSEPFVSTTVTITFRSLVRDERT